MDTAKKFPVECLEDVFRHLGGNDLLECSLVSPDWSVFVGSTKSCMEKITLTSVNFERNPDYLESILKNSQRRYERLELKGPLSINSRELLLAKGRKWTHIDFKRVRNFPTVNDFLEFLMIVQSSVQKLVIHSTYVIKDSDVSFQTADLKFPKLKLINLCCASARHFDKAFVNCRSLENVTLNLNYSMPPPLLSSMRATLAANVGLKAFTCSGISLFVEDLQPTISFNLTKFEIFILPGKPEEERNLNFFLKCQMNSIETLTIGTFITAELLRTILSMPRLKKIKILNGLHPFEFAENLPQNKSVTELNLYVYGSDDEAITNFLLPLFPKTETLTILRMSRDIAELIPEACQFLKHLLVARFETETITNKAFYSGLHTFSSSFCESKKSEKLFSKLNGKLKLKNDGGSCRQPC